MFPKLKRTEMTDEQVGLILRVSDELGHWEDGLDFIKEHHTKQDAQEEIDRLEQFFCPCGDVIPLTPQCQIAEMCEACLDAMV